MQEVGFADLVFANDNRVLGEEHIQVLEISKIGYLNSRDAHMTESPGALNLDQPQTDLDGLVHAVHGFSTGAAEALDQSLAVNGTDLV